MTYDELKILIAPDEHRTLELKKTTGELKDGMHSACAFLNTEGGWLIFGVAPKSLKILGQQVTDNTQREIAQALSHLYPAVDAQIEYIDVPDRPGDKVIVMHFGGWVWGKEPYTYRGCPYYRRESTTEEMPRNIYDERLKAAQPHKFGWEKQLAEGMTASNVDEERLRAAVRLGVERGRLAPTANGESVETLLRKFKLLKDGELTQGGMMLFGKDTDNYPQLLLRMARFVGTDKDEFIDNQRARGNFFDLLDAGMQFAYKHLNISGKIIELQRKDKLEIPIKAMREALINAYCHRTFEQPGASVSLAIYDDRVEICNPGRLPNELTPEKLLLPHDSFPMNPDIADVLFLTTYLDSWGSGVKRILDACAEDGVPAPHYEIRPGCVVIVFPRSNVSKPTNENQTDEKHLSVTDLTERQKVILSMIANEPSLTATEMSVSMSVSARTVERELSLMRKSGIIRREGRKNDGQWVVLTNRKED